MNQPFNQLTDAEAERLANLMEECAEVIKTCGKILRHGYESVDPTGVEEGTNREQLQRELGDVSGWVEAMDAERDVDMDVIMRAADERIYKIARKVYQHHQP